MAEEMDSKWRLLATAPMLGQAPGTYDPGNSPALLQLADTITIVYQPLVEFTDQLRVIERRHVVVPPVVWQRFVKYQGCGNVCDTGEQISGNRHIDIGTIEASR